MLIYTGYMKKGGGQKLKKASVFTAVHAGKWVALNTAQTRVLDIDTDITALVSRVGRDGVIYTKVTDPRVSYSFCEVSV